MQGTRLTPCIFHAILSWFAYRPHTSPEGSGTLTTRVSRLIAALTALTLILTAAPASAEPSVSSKRAQAERVKAQVEGLDQRVEIAAEQYNEAAIRHRRLSNKVATTRKKLKRIRARTNKLQGTLNKRAEGMYRSGPLSFLEVLLGASDFEEFAAAWDLLTNVNQKDADVIRDLKAARVEAASVANKLEKAETSAKKERDRMASRKASVQGQLAERKRMLSGLEGEIAALEAAERRRDEAAAKAAREAARRRSFASRGDSGGNPSRASRSEVVNIAMRYLGTPYRWGASGPNAFDCSGFTMYVYAQVGVSLPHSSRAQYGSGERVSRANLQPGDLVFFGSPIHHVGIYVGGGSYIHAPHTGAVVSVSSLSRGDYAGACRP